MYRFPVSWLRLQINKSYHLDATCKACLMVLRSLPPLFSLPLAHGMEPPLEKFVIFGQTRSGTHLLRDLLNTHPEVHCEAELFDQHVPRLFSPELFVEAKRNSFKRKAFGFILHLRHILMMTGLEQDEFLSKLHNKGWRIIHLSRKNVLRQQLSLEIGKERRIWHTNSNNALPSQKFKIDVDDLFKRVRLRKIKAKFEAELMAQGPHMDIIYEDDLLNGEMHQHTLDRVFEYLKLPSVPVSTALARTSLDSLKDMIVNYYELEKAVVNAGYGEFLSQPPTSTDQIGQGGLKDKETNHEI